MIGRREFIAGLGGAAAAWPLAVRAQQPALPLAGIVDITTLGISFRQQALSAFRRGLNETGYIEGRNTEIEYNTVRMQFDRVSGLAADLLHRQVAVIFAIGPPTVREIRAQSMTIPIVFFVGEDPVKEGLVARLNRPGGNTTGTTNFGNLLFAKQLQLLREVVPKAKVFALTRTIPMLSRMLRTCRPQPQCWCGNAGANGQKRSRVGKWLLQLWMNSESTAC